MWTNDDDFGVRGGVLVLSKNPSLKIERDRLVIGDGYQPGTSRKPHSLRLTRAECARGRLRHIVMVGDAGWCSNAAQHWLRDVGCALQQVGAIDSGVRHLNQCFARARLRHARLRERQHFRRSRLARGSVVHRVRYRHGCCIGE